MIWRLARWVMQYACAELAFLPEYLLREVCYKRRVGKEGARDRSQELLALVFCISVP